MIKQIIFEHLKKYPESEITDIVKLVYQNEFGGGHLIADEEMSLKRIQGELELIQFDPEKPLTEDIGNGIVRVNLSATRGKISAEAINKCFILSAKVI